ncbi:MAG: bacteriohemerythrin [Clostridiales bacterium]|nr:bacteriohemerythrin [Clostridiales bacterium]
MKTPILRYEKGEGANKSESNTMKYGVAWNDSFKLGNEQVDEQHRKLFEVVSNLVAAHMEGRDAEKLQETLDFLANYTCKHFQDEEALQVRYGYPDYERHKQLHEDFKVTVDELVQRYSASASTAELSSDVNRIVVRWLVNHIQREDKKIVEHIRKTAAQLI